jgi:RNA-directed DNA polymerase
LKAVRRGKRRKENLTVESLLAEVGAVPEPELESALTPLSVEEELLFEPSQLMERVVERENMKRAYARVMRNKGACGVDEMPVSALKDYLKVHWPKVKEELLKGNYEPKPVKRVEIPKQSGGVRLLGIPTVLDRLIQQALNQVLSPIFEPHFSQRSFGFRPGRSAHQAVKLGQKFVTSGKVWVVDVDLEKFFDRVNHDVMLSRLERRVKDFTVIKLIRKYLKAGIMVDGDSIQSEEGTPQGGPLSPLLSNILLDDLDKELEMRGHDFARYADDCQVFVGSETAGTRVLGSITNYLEKELKLKVNREKSQVVRAHKTKFLGYSLTSSKEPKLRVPRQVIAKLKVKLRAIFRAGRGRNLKRFINEDLNPIIRGWINYFKLAEVKRFCEELDSWIRRKLRLVLWRQWKKPWTRRKKLMQLGLPEEQAVMSAFNQRGPWWNSGASHMNRALPKQYFDRLGLVAMLDKLLESQRSLRNRRDR